jgi:hypothetical protein
MRLFGTEPNEAERVSEVGDPGLIYWPAGAMLAGVMPGPLRIE